MSWPTSTVGNRYIQTYIQGFLDISGGDIILRNNGNLYIGGDSSFNGNINIVSGNLTTSNTIGNIYTNNAETINLGTQSATNVFIGKSTSSTTTINTDLSVNNHLRIGGDASFNGNLMLQKNVFLQNDLSMNGNLKISTGNVLTTSSTASLFTTNATNIFMGPVNGRITMQNDVSINGGLSVQKDSSFNGNLLLQKDLSMNGNLKISTGNIITSSNTGNLFTTASNVFIGSTNGITTTNNKLMVLGDMSLNGNLVITSGNIQTTNSDASIYTDSNINNVFIGSTSGNSTIQNDLSLNGRLLVGGDASFNGNLLLQKDLSMNGDLKISTGNIITSSNTGNLFTTASDVFIGSTSGITTTNNKLMVLGDMSLNGNLVITSGNIQTTNSDASIYTNSNINNVFIGSTTGNTTIQNDLSLNGRLLVGGDASLNGNLFLVSGNLQTTSQTTPLVLQNNAGSVGIGITPNTTYNYILDVSGITHTNGLVVGNGTPILYTSNQTLTPSQSGCFIDCSAANMTLTLPATSTNVPSGTKYIISTSSTSTLVTLSIPVADQSSVHFYGYGGKNLFNITTKIYSIGLSQNRVIEVVFDGSRWAIIGGDFLFDQNPTFYGNVGIGSTMTTPQNTLDVSGSFRVTGNTILGGDITLNGNLMVLKDLSLNGNLKTSTGTISTTSNSANLFTTASNIFIGNITGAGNTVIQNDLSVNGNLTVNKNVTIFNGNLFSGNANNANLFIDTSDIIIGRSTSNITTSGTAFFSNDVIINSNIYTNTNIETNELTVANLFTNGNTRAIYIGNAAVTNQTLTVNVPSTIYGNLTLISGDVITTQTGTANLFNTNATTLNIGGASTTTNIGASSNGSTIINNNLTISGGYISCASGNILSGNTTYASLYSTTSNIFIGKAPGNVIIASDLSVNRNVYINGDVSLNGNIYVKGGTIDCSNATVNLFTNRAIGNLSLLSASGNLFIRGNRTTMNDLSVNGNIYGRYDLSVNGNVNIGNGFINTSNTTGNIFTANATTINIGSSSNSTIIGANMTLNKDLSLNSGNLFVQGTEVVGNMTSVKGAIYIGKNIGTDQGGLQFTTDFNNNAPFGYSAINSAMDVTNNGSPWKYGSSETNSSSTVPLVLQSNGGKVGIGTTNPQCALDVFGTAIVVSDISSIPVVEFKNNYATGDISINDPIPMIRLIRNGSNGQSWNAEVDFNVCKYKTSSGGTDEPWTRLDIKLKNGANDNPPDTNVLTLLSEGKVGINNTAPVYQLDVNGRGKLLATNNSDNLKNSLYLKGDLDTNDIAFLHNLNDGNYNGTVSAGSSALIFDISAYNVPTKPFVIAPHSSSGTGGISINGNETGKVGYVGIGKQSPSEMLDVNGNIKTAGNLITSSTTANLFNTNATTLNIGGEASTINMGNSSTSSNDYCVVMNGGLIVKGSGTVNITSSTTLTAAQSGSYFYVENPYLSVTLPAGTTKGVTYYLGAKYDFSLNTANGTSIYLQNGAINGITSLKIPNGRSITVMFDSVNWAVIGGNYELVNYLTTSAASSTYLTTTAASSTYAPLASPTFTGSVTVGGKIVSASNSSDNNSLYLNSHQGNTSIGFYHNLNDSDYNPIVISGASALIFNRDGIDLTNPFVIAPHSANTGGISIKGNTGYVGIGTRAPTEMLDVNGNIKASQFIATGSSRSGLITFYINTTRYGYIGYVDSANGEIILGCDGTSPGYICSKYIKAASFNATSDYRIKENVKPLDASFNVDNLKPITYTVKSTGKQDIGFLAHELQEVYPFLVTGTKDDPNAMQTINYNGLIGVLVKEVQTLKQEVQTSKQETQTLKQEVQNLKGENEELKVRLKRIEDLLFASK